MAYTPDPQTTLQRYLDAWNTDDADRRWAHVHAATADAVVLLDPDAEGPVQGQAALAAHADPAHSRRGRVEATGPPDLVLGTVRLPVRWMGEDGVWTGAVVGTLDTDVRLEWVVHFIDPN
jgi:hypothetical protein